MLVVQKKQCLIDSNKFRIEIDNLTIDKFCSELDKRILWRIGLFRTIFYLLLNCVIRYWWINGMKKRTSVIEQSAILFWNTKTMWIVTRKIWTDVDIILYWSLCKASIKNNFFVYILIFRKAEGLVKMV